MRLCKQSVLRRIALAVMFCGLSLELIAGSAASSIAQGLPSRDVVFLIDNSPSVRVGGEAGDKPSDPQNLRIRLARFAVAASGQITQAAEQRVGAVSFGRTADILVPLTPVQDWAKADFAKVDSVDAGPDTNFTAALNVAKAMILPTDASACNPTERSCEVVIISDGELYGSIERQLPSLTEALEALKMRGVRVTLLTFAEADATSRSVWQGYLARGLLAQHEMNITQRFSRSPQEVYGLLFDLLGVRSLLSDFESVIVPGVITREQLPYRRWARWEIITDSSIEPVFTLDSQAATPVRVGTDYFFWEPPAGVWRVDLKGEGLAYFRLSEEVAPIVLNMEKLPELVPVGREIPVTAKLTVGAGTVVTQTDLFTVTAVARGPKSLGPFPLTRSGLLFTTTLSTVDMAIGTYVVEISAVADERVKATVSPITDSFHIILTPVLGAPQVPVTQVSEIGQLVPVTVTVTNCPTADCFPKLLVYTAGLTKTVPLASIDGGMFAALLSLQETAAVVSHLGAGLGYEEQKQGPIVIRTPSLPPARPRPGMFDWYWLLVTIAVGVILGAVCTAFFIYRPDIVASVSQLPFQLQLRGLDQEVERMEKNISKEEIVSPEMVRKVLEIDQFIDRAWDKIEASKNREVSRKIKEVRLNPVWQGTVRRLIARGDLPDLAIRRIEEISRKGWYWEMVAGAALGEVLKRSGANSVILMDELLKRYQLPPAVLEIASRCLNPRQEGLT